MKTSKYLKAMFGLTVLTFCLPWFTYNAKVMGYCWGYDFLRWFLVPMALVALCLFLPRRNAALILLAEVAQIVNFAGLVCAFGRWQEVCNIQSGFQWQDGFRTVQPGFWVAVSFFVLFFLNFQIDLVKGMPKSAER